METWTIESVPYYTFANRDAMYQVGVTFYAVYFLPTFPMFFYVDEEGMEAFSSPSFEFYFIFLRSFRGGELVSVARGRGGVRWLHDRVYLVRRVAPRHGRLHGHPDRRRCQWRQFHYCPLFAPCLLRASCGSCAI